MREKKIQQDLQTPTRGQLNWFLLFRVIIITLFLGGTILYHARAGYAQHPAVPFLYLLIGLTYFQALVSLLALRGLRRLRVFTQAQIVWDLVFVTCLIYLTGGSESLFSFLYLLVIIGSSFLLARKEALIVAAAASILYGGLLDLQYFGIVQPLGFIRLTAAAGAGQVFYAIFINVSAFFLTALLAGTLSERLRSSERALEKREIDYEELENLNRTILANINSGLMIINERGRIRSLNEAASRITSYALEQIYDRDIREIFPHLDVYAGEFRIVSRAEGVIRDGTGNRHVIGYDSSLLKARQGQTLGLLITFQDLTHFKEMEERLKRADRLAAAGQLASGMAHEIRNPLASISGSVQLLMEGENVSPEEKRLMGIVVKEAERLSALLTDFLVFAKPASPNIEDVDVSALLDELADLMKTDGRFSEIEIRKEYTPGQIFALDRGQFRQALWNLAINGAEAMTGEGTLWLGIDAEKGEIFIEDTGPGVTPEIRDKVFDPFFTTKDSGTGLGLATVYTILERHGARVALREGRQSGARFVVGFNDLDSGREQAATTARRITVPD